MTDMAVNTPAHAKTTFLDRLTGGQHTMLRFAIGFVIVDMCGGFWLSYQNLSQAAAHHGWHTPWALPLIIDAGIPTYIIIDYLLVALGCRSWLARSIAWLFALLTVYLNGAVTPATSLQWRVAAMAAPSAWVLGIEVIRLLWRVLAKGEVARREGIPVERWLANPFTAAMLARRKALLGVGPWALMNAIEDARVFLRDAVAAVRRKRPDLPVPLSVSRAMRTGRFPGEVRAAIEQGVKDGGAAHWEPVTAGWLTSRMGLTETLAEAISNPPRIQGQTRSEHQVPGGPGEAPEGGSETPSRTQAETPSQTGSEPDPQTRSERAPRKRRQTRSGYQLTAAQSRSMTTEDLASHVLALWEEKPGAGRDTVMSELHIGKPKAVEAMAIARRKRTVVPMSAREETA